MVAKIRILLGVFSILFLGLVARLFYWQIVKGAELSSEAQAQYNSSTVTPPPAETFWPLMGVFGF